MAEKISLNCLGMKCPRPIIEIAKAARKASSGTILTVVADDLAFESDARAWVEQVDATINKLDKKDKQITIEIVLK